MEVLSKSEHISLNLPPSNPQCNASSKSMAKTNQKVKKHGGPTYKANSLLNLLPSNPRCIGISNEHGKTNHKTNKTYMDGRKPHLRSKQFIELTSYSSPQCIEISTRAWQGQTTNEQLQTLRFEVIVHNTVNSPAISCSNPYTVHWNK